MSNSMLERIRALLRKAEDAGVTEAEANALSAKAFDLAAKYEIDETLIAMKSERPTERLETRKGTVSRPFTQMAQLANEVYKFCGAKIVMVGKDAYYAHGFSFDLDRSEMLLTSLLVQGTRWQLYDYRDSGAKEDGERRSTYKRSWWNGYVASLHQRFIAAKKSAATENDSSLTSTGTELMLRDKSALVDQKIAETHGRLRHTKSRGTTGSGYSSGRAAGQRADIGGQKLSGRSRAIDR